MRSELPQTRESELVVPNNSASQTIDLTLPGDKVVTFPGSTAVTISKDLLLTSLTPTGVPSGTSIIAQAVDGSSVPEPDLLALMAASSMTGLGFMARRRKV
jgi:hypothetical protein